MIETAPGRAVTRVEVGGKLSNRKGISLPDTTVPFSALTAKDRSDLEAALDAGIDWVGLSFVQRPEDVAEAKKITRGRAAVMAKIEKPQAVTRLGEILDLVDALMVARGDLGVEMPLEKVPGVQKQITRTARRAGKPVVVATQMLESMISNPVPTRAEVSDVATAVFEGADAIMLSAESAAGKYPVESVAMMNRIAEEVESDPTYRSIVEAQRAEPEATGSDAIAAAARGIAETLVLSAIVCWTSSGSTALRVARERPKSPIIAISPNLSTGRKLSVVWGVHCVIAQDARDLDDVVDRACCWSPAPTCSPSTSSWPCRRERSRTPISSRSSSTSGTPTSSPPPCSNWPATPHPTLPPGSRRSSSGLRCTSGSRRRVRSSRPRCEPCSRPRTTDARRRACDARLSWPGLSLACLGWSRPSTPFDASRFRSVPDLIQGRARRNLGAKRAQNCTLFMKTIEGNQSLKPVQFVKLHL